MRYKVGMKVNCPEFGKGSIVYFMGGDYLVQFDDFNPTLHSGSGRVKDGHAWWFNDVNIREVVELPLREAIKKIKNN